MTASRVAVDSDDEPRDQGQHADASAEPGGTGDTANNARWPNAVWWLAMSSNA